MLLASLTKQNSNLFTSKGSGRLSLGVASNFSNAGSNLDLNAMKAKNTSSKITY